MTDITTTWSTTQTRSQYAAIAWLRWRILINSFRRKGETGELVGRIFLYILFGSITVTFVVGAGAVAYACAVTQHLDRLAWVLWGIFILCQLLNIQLGQPGTTFDPTQLIRFPLGSRTYVFIRLFFGLLSPANIIGTLMSFAVALGLIVALPRLWFFALFALAVFALTNVLFSRMVFAWVDRWLSTRRAREVFTGLIFAGSLGIQWLNFTFNPAYNRHGQHHSINPQQLDLAQRIYQHAHPLLAWLPPELTSTAILSASRSVLPAALGYTFACAAFAALFLLIFALRMNTEYRGESLSDAANAVAVNKKTKTLPSRPNAPHLVATTLSSGPEAAHLAATTLSSRPEAASFAVAAERPASSAPARTFALPPTVLAMLGKELLYVRRTQGILYGLIMPVFLVLILAGRVASRSNAFWVFPAAVSYTLLVVGPMSYNAFGYDAAGAQFYFLAPIRMREILLSKNIFTFLAALVEIFAVLIIISKVATVPSLQVAVSTVLWAAGTLAINTIFGNRRSITTPKKVNLQRMANKQASQVSALLSLGIMATAGAFAAGIFALTAFFHQQWLLVPVFAIYAAVGIFFYVQSLNGLDTFARDHREDLLTELTKKD